MTAQIVMLSRHGRVKEWDGHHRLTLFPRNYGTGLVYLYAIGLANGGTKIGRSGKPRSRIAQHWVAAEGGIVWMHLFGGTERHLAIRIERRALTLAAINGERIGNTEVFRSLSRDRALQCVRMAFAEFRD